MSSVSKAASFRLVLVASGGLWLAACADRSPGVTSSEDAGPWTSPYCNGDRDGDGWSNWFEGDWDADDDGIANADDLDSDGDGTPDSEAPAYRDEGIPDSCASPVPSGLDGLGAAWDLDDDDDGISDVEERATGTDPDDEDSDDDGCLDPAEHYFGGCDSPFSTIAFCGRSRARDVCGGHDGAGTDNVASLVAPMDAPHGSVSARVVPVVTTSVIDTEVYVDPVSVLPAGAATISADGFASVATGARLAFEVHAASCSPVFAIRLEMVEVVDELGTVLFRAGLLVRGMGCPKI